MTQLAQRRPRRRGLLQPEQQRLRRALPHAARAAAGRAARSTARSSTRTRRSTRPSAAASRYPFRMPFTPRGMYSITPFTHGNDEAAPVGAGGVRVGKFTHPSAAPEQRPAGGVDARARPTTSTARRRCPYYDAGLYLMPGGDIVDQPERARADQERSRLQRSLAARGRAVPRRARRRRAGAAAVAAERRHACTPTLPAGTPYGLVGTSSFYKRESFPGVVPPWSNTFDGLDAFNTARERPEQQLGLRRAPTPASTPTPTSGRCASSRWSPARTAATARTAARAAASSSTATRTSGCASSARSRCASSTPAARRSSIPRAIPTRASWRRFPPTRRSRSRRSTATAWC